MSTARFEYGYNSINVLEITGAPSDTDPSSFEMLHDGSKYRLYMRSVSNPAQMYQFVYQPGTNGYVYVYVYGYGGAIPRLTVMAPSDADWERWGMLHDGSTYRHYVFKTGSEDTFYQSGYNVSTGRYEYGYNSIPTQKVENMPANSDTSAFAMLHDRVDYHFYFLVL